MPNQIYDFKREEDYEEKDEDGFSLEDIHTGQEAVLAELMIITTKYGCFDMNGNPTDAYSLDSRLAALDLRRVKVRIFVRTGGPLKTHRIEDSSYRLVINLSRQTIFMELNRWSTIWYDLSSITFNQELTLPGRLLRLR